MCDIRLCSLKNMFGKPGYGVHSIRIFDIAIVDLLLTILISWLLARYFNRNFWLILGIVLVIGIISHRLFCVRTTIDKILFPNA